MNTIRKGRYRHYKGQEYELVDIARNSETLEYFVVYRALYGNQQLWIRPKEMFFEHVLKDGQNLPRFEYVDTK